MADRTDPDEGALAAAILRRMLTRFERTMEADLGDVPPEARIATSIMVAAAEQLGLIWLAVHGKSDPAELIAWLSERHEEIDVLTGVPNG